MDNGLLELAFCAEAIMCTWWDKPEITEEEKRLALYTETANAILEMEKKQG